MDPNETLNEIRRLVRANNSSTFAMRDEDTTYLTELVESLDQWLSRGGFLPQAWERGTK